MKSSIRITFAFVLSFLLGVVISLSNGRGFLLSLQAGLVFAVFAALIIGVLSWGIEIATRKGYSDWVGLLFVLFLNVLGLVLLVILPIKSTTSNRTSK